MKLRNKYFILRHGDTIYLIKKKEFIYPPFSQKPAIKLTKKGKEQVKAATRKLKKLNIDLIFSSDFFRTRQTAKIVAKELDIRKISFDKRLRDVNLGIYRNKRKTDLYRAFPDVKLRFKKRMPKGESWSDVEKRMLKFLKDVDKKYKRKTILIIGHGDPLWLLEGAVKNWSKGKLLRIKSGKGIIKTGEIRRL